MDSDTNDAPKGATEEAILEVIKTFNQEKQGAPERYQEILDEIEEYSKGEGDNGVRDAYYEGWTDDDFKKLLERLKEE
ncbi:MAG: hypothetical protein CMI53_02695 [Parcubacteria group bacterium]|nr:hypothetical protein [Parcubacteria group bacterium]|tara:strand:- start:96 stop:329 length:234 start_codon:yes stop_codon:yes gene_type:complete